MRRALPRRLLDVWGDPLGPSAGERLGTALFLLLVVFVAFYDLGARGLHTLDLPRFGVLAREMLSSGEWLVPTRYGEVYANKPPLCIWLIAAPAAVVGDVTPFLVRLPSALGLVLMVLATSAWGRVRTGFLVRGRAAALLLLGTYAVTRFGREGRPDMLAAGFVIAGTYYLDRAALGRGRRSDPWIAGGLFGLALLAKGPALLIVPLLVLLLPSVGRPTVARWRSARPHVVLGAALALAALWFVPATLHGGADYAKALLLDQATTRIAGTANHVEDGIYYARRLVDGAAPWTPLYLLAVFLLLWRRGRAVLGDTLPLVFAALFVLVLFSAVPTKHLRYVLPVFSLLAVPAGALVCRFLARETGRPWNVARKAGGVAFVVLALGCAVVGGLVDGSLLPLLAPGIGFLALAFAAFVGRESGEDTPAAARRRLTGSVLVGMVLLVAVFWIVRDRYRVRTREAFDDAVAEVLVDGIPVRTLAPVEPGDVFHAAPLARLAREIDDLEGAEVAPRLFVVVDAARADDVEAFRGEPARVLLEQQARSRGPTLVLLGFGLR